MRQTKLLIPVISILILALLLSSCQRAKPQRVFNVGGLTYAYSEVRGDVVTYRSTAGESTMAVTVEPDPNRELRQNRYRIVIDGQVYLLSGDSRRVELIFPDGREVGTEYSGSMSLGYAGIGDQVSFEEWGLADDLHKMLFPEPQRSTRSSGSFFIGLLLLASGAFSAANPRAAWFLNRGWMYRDAEPSDLYLGLSRVGGIIGVIIGLLVMVGGID